MLLIITVFIWQINVMLCYVITSGVYIFSYRFNSYSSANTGSEAIKKEAFSFLFLQLEGLAIHRQTQGRRH